MLDAKFVRENLDSVRKGIESKGEGMSLDEFVSLDSERKKIQYEVEQLKHKRNLVSEEVAQAKKLKIINNEIEKKIKDMREAGNRIQELDERLNLIEKELEGILLRIPNLPHPSVQSGTSELENQEIRRWGKIREFSFEPKPHWEIGEKLGIIDFQRGVKVSGTRFYLMRGLGAKLERVLIDWMIEVHTEEHGYTEVLPPFLVNRNSMIGTGQLPKFEDDMYRCDADDLFLNPTAEVPVTNLHRDEVLDADALPIKYVAYTTCFRREAGAYGKDTRGIVRVHQFNKIEMVKFVHPEKSYEELELLLEDACDILKRLLIPYRVVQMCTGDLGFAASKKYDPEAWFLGQKKYVEVSSISNFEAFQARRANIKFRPAKGEKLEYVHTLNGSGLAVGRTLAAILEYYQNEDGSVTVPEVLRERMGCEIIK